MISTVTSCLGCGLYLFKESFNGLSPGKALFGLRVVDNVTGCPIGPVKSFLRTLPLLLPLVPIICLFQIISGPRIGDGWAHTKVIWRRDSGQVIGQADVFNTEDHKLEEK